MPENSLWQGGKDGSTVETVKLFDAEWNLMEIVWETAPTTASRIAAIAGQRFDWAKNTTYTVLKRLISKGVLERSGTDFTVTPLVTRRQMQLVELNNLVEKRFGGSEAEMLEVLCRDGCPDPAHRQALVQVLEELR